jgi:hypothetical protein
LEVVEVVQDSKRMEQTSIGKAISRSVFFVILVVELLSIKNEFAMEMPNIRN